MWPLLCWNMLRVFILKGFYSFVNAFSAFIEMILWFLSLILLMWYIQFLDFHAMNHFCTLGINLTRSWFIMLLIHSWNWFLIFFQISISIFIRNIDLYFSFLVVSLSGFGNSAFIEWIWKYSIRKNILRSFILQTNKSHYLRWCGIGLMIYIDHLKIIREYTNSPIFIHNPNLGQSQWWEIVLIMVLSYLNV